MKWVTSSASARIWPQKALIKAAGTANPTFVGKVAKIEFGKLKGVGARGSRSRSRIQAARGRPTRTGESPSFFNELMTGFVGAAGNPLSRLTVGSLQDLGYVVDFGSAAEAYSLPNLTRMAEEGLLVSARATAAGFMLPNIPVILPEDSLR